MKNKRNKFDEILARNSRNIVHIKNARTAANANGNTDVDANANTDANHYENMPIQICRKFHLQKLKIFR